MNQQPTKAPFWQQANDVTCLLVMPIEEPRADGIAKLSTVVLGYVTAVGTVNPLYQSFAYTGTTQEPFSVRARHDQAAAQADVVQFLKDINRWPVIENEVVSS